MLVVGCGLGDDAELLAAQGAMVTALDVSPSAIGWCRRRFGDSRVRYEVADLLAPPPAWIGAFGLVVEIHTLQALPADLRPRAIAPLASLVGPDGRLLVVTRGRRDGEPEGDLPWPLLHRELVSIGECGLALERLEELPDQDDGAALRFRATFRRPPDGTSGLLRADGELDGARDAGR